MKLAFKLCLLLFLLAFGTEAQNACTVEPMRLTINGEPLFGTTVNASAGTQNGCGVAKVAPEVNYTVVGNGLWLTATTCNDATTFPTSMAIAYDICGSDCLEDSFVGYPNCDNVNGVGITWQSVFNQSYTISVFGRQVASAGEFVISVFDYLPPINNWCSKAILLDVNGDETKGSTVNATLKTGDGCGVTKSAPEVYYHVVGTGATLTVTTCSPRTTYETSLALFAETCKVNCLAGNYNDPLCDNLNGASITWESTFNTTYEIEVFGRQEQSGGDFAIRVFDTSPKSQNPTPGPTSPPILPPTPAPTLAPTAAPTKSPTANPTTSAPSDHPSSASSPTRAPTVAPTAKPTSAQTKAQFQGFGQMSHGSQGASMSTIACVISFGILVMFQ